MPSTILTTEVFTVVDMCWCIVTLLINTFGVLNQLRNQITLQRLKAGVSIGLSKELKTAIMNVSFISYAPKYSFLIIVFIIPLTRPVFFFIFDTFKILSLTNSLQISLDVSLVIKGIYFSLYLVELVVKNVFLFCFFFMTYLVPKAVEVRDQTSEESSVAPMGDEARSLQSNDQKYQKIISISMRKGLLFTFLGVINQILFQVFHQKLFLNSNETLEMSILPNFIIIYAGANYFITMKCRISTRSSAKLKTPDFIAKLLADYLPNTQQIVKWRNLSRVGQNMKEIRKAVEEKAKVLEEKEYKNLKKNEGDRIYLIDMFVFSVLALSVTEAILVLPIICYLAQEFSANSAQRSCSATSAFNGVPYSIYICGVRPFVFYFIEPLSIYFGNQKEVVIGKNYVRKTSRKEELKKQKKKEKESQEQRENSSFDKKETNRDQENI